MFFNREALLCSLLGFYVHKTYGMGLHANDCDEIIMQVDPTHLICIHTTSKGGLAQFAFSSYQFNAYFMRMWSIWINAHYFYRADRP